MPWAGRLLQAVAQQISEALARIGRRQFDEHVPLGPLIERIGDSGDVFDRQFDGEARHQFECGHPIARRLLQLGQQLQSPACGLEPHECRGRVRGAPETV